MSNKSSENEYEKEQVLEDTPENRAWIGETESQPLPEKNPE